MAPRRSTVFDTGAAPMDLRTGIIETANALGMDPADLATIISYETGGTFNPTQAGPTTKWGQHRGLIQFGEPQAKQYGVDWNDPLGSQLGSQGAIVQYFLNSGWKPEMDLLNAYSIVNAGGPGRFNASDTAAGGAPGTVRDKVEQQMGGHREKALALLGAGYAGSVGSYDPRLDTPSTGTPVGSMLPGPPASAQAPTAYTRSRSPYAVPPTGKTQDKYGKAAAGALKGLAEMKAPVLGAGGNAPQLPAMAPLPMDAMPFVSGGGGDQGRDDMARLMARLNSQTLWG